MENETRPVLTDPQRAALVRAARAHRAGQPWIRSTTAGERVTLASLHGRGYLERRAWRGDGGPDSAFEYRLAAAVAAELDRRRSS